MGRPPRLPAAVLWAAAAWGCASARPAAYLAPDFASAAPRAVAVLPFDNESMSFEAPETLRRLVAERLLFTGAKVLYGEEVDERLKSLGVTDGGQLGAYAPADIGAALGADGLLYGRVEEFVYQNVGFVRKREVRLRLKLVSAPEGKRLWEDAGSGTSVRLAFKKSEAGRAFIEGVLEQTAERLFKAPLEAEAESAVDDVLSRYPRR